MNAFCFICGLAKINLKKIKKEYMKYMGSKARIAKEILPIILKDRKPNQWYVEPFVGGSNLIENVYGNRIGNDINHYLIEFSKALQNGWLPPKEIGEEMFNEIKKQPNDYEPCLVGYVGFQLTYGAMWMGSYRRDNEGKRNYSHEAYNNVKKQAPKLKDIRYLNTEYYKIEMPENSLIYCDPPYKDTAKYKANETPFNYDMFYSWCRNMAKQGHQIFISEYQMPEDFICIWEKEICSSLGKNTGAKKATEKLFTLMA